MIDQWAEWLSNITFPVFLTYIAAVASSIICTGMYYVRRMAKVKAKIRSESELRRLEILSNYAEDLMAKRIEVYKECYSTLSEFVKVSLGFRSGRKEYVGVSRDQLSEFNEKLSDWDSKYAIFLSGGATGKVFHLRKSVRDALSSFDTLSEGDGFLKKEEFVALLKKIESAEVALKTDIGVLAVDAFISIARPEGYTDHTVTV